MVFSLAGGGSHPWVFPGMGESVPGLRSGCSLVLLVLHLQLPPHSQEDVRKPLSVHQVSGLSLPSFSRQLSEQSPAQLDSPELE
jgi:hypothetical protein